MDERINRDFLLKELQSVYKQLTKMKPPRAAELTPAAKRKLDHCLDLHRIKIYCLQTASGPIKDSELDLMNERLAAIETRIAEAASS